MIKRNRNGLNGHLFAQQSCSFCERIPVALDNDIYYCMAHWWRWKSDPQWAAWEDLLALARKSMP